MMKTKHTFWLTVCVIDDQPGVDRTIMDKAVNYVAQALAEAKAGKPVLVPATAPYGCSVKY